MDLSTPEAEDVSPQQAWQMIKEMRGTKLVDVRTVPEWLYVGLPEIEGTEGALLKISWHVFPDMTMNVAFIEDLKRAASSDDVLLFVCRSGGRSLAAGVEVRRPAVATTIAQRLPEMRSGRVQS